MGILNLSGSRSCEMNTVGSKVMGSVVAPSCCCYSAWTSKPSPAASRLQHSGGLSLRQESRYGFKVLAISSNDFRPGTEIELDNAPWRVLEFLHVKPGKGAAFVRTKLRNCITGNTVEKTFRAGENVEDAKVEKNLKQFTYMEGDQYVFMDMETFEEVRLSAKEIGDRAKWMREGMECNVISWKDKIIGVDLPITVKYKVVQAQPGVKGNRESGGSKPATLDTGAVVNVPLFVEAGEEVVIDTRTGTYMNRAK